MKKTVLLVVAAGIALAACSGGHSDEPQPANETIVANIDETMNVTNVSTTAPAATEIDNSVASQAPPTATLTADEQTQADADATGMTAKVDRSGDMGNGTAGQPAH